MKGFVPMAPILPQGESGNVKLDHFTVSKADADRHQLSCMFNGELPVKPGTYARLWVDGQVMMSDTPMEQRDNSYVVYKAKGDVFIAGLGLGMIVAAMAEKPEVTSITVVEKSDDVIKLVAPALTKQVGDKLTIIEDDIFDYKPERNRKWDTIYFDIWPTICSSNLDEMSTLHRRFGRRKPTDGYMSSWNHDWVKAEDRKNKADERNGRFPW